MQNRKTPSKSKKTVLSVVINIWFVIMALCGFYLLIAFLKADLGKSLSKIGIELGPISTRFMIITFFFVLIALIKYIIEDTSNKRSKSKYCNILKQNINYYFLTTIYLIVLIFTIGLGFLSDEYNKEIPIPLLPTFAQGSNNPNIVPTLSNMVCNSKLEFNKFVEGDRLYCDFNITYQNNTDFVLREIEVIQYLSNDSFKTTYRQRYDYKHFNGRALIDLFEGGRKVIADIFISLDNGKGPYVIYSYRLDKSLMKREEYSTREQQKIPLIIALLSLSSVSAVIFVRNLREIIHPK